MLERLSSAFSMLLCFVLSGLVMSIAAGGPSARPANLRAVSLAAGEDPIGALVRRSRETVRAPRIVPRRVSTATIELPGWFSEKPIDNRPGVERDATGAGRFAIVPLAVPVPRLASRPAAKSVWPVLPHAHAITKLVALGSAPFPYDGNVPGRDSAFFDVEEDGRRGHGASHGRVLWEGETFSDPRSLLHIPAGFDVDRPGVLVLFFHGHRATLTRDVWHRQQLPQQISGSGMNAVLVAPQFAYDAADSSSGKFWQKGGLKRYLRDVTREFAALYGKPRARRAFARMPVIVVAYSGGFAPAAVAIRSGALAGRLRGVVLLDAMYGYREIFEGWAGGRNGGFFVNVYGQSTERRSRFFETQMGEQNIAIASTMPERLGHGEVISIEADVPHRDYVSMAFAAYPVADILRRVTFAAPVRPQSQLAGAWR